MDYTNYVENICANAKKASRQTALLSDKEKCGILKNISSEIRERKDFIIAENKKDIVEAEKNLSSAMVDRLLLNDKRIDALASSVDEISLLNDPVGRVEKISLRPSGIRVGQMRVPIGVIAVIYESRPNVTIDIAAICIKSGNAAILRGGKEAINSNKALYDIIKSAIRKSGYDENIITLIENTDRELVPVLLKKNNYIDLVIPRGGHGLIKYVCENSSIPVIKHDKGVCHTFIDVSADKQAAADIAVNAKVSRPSVCNAMETLLFHKDFSDKKFVLEQLIAKGVTIYGCGETRKIIPDKILEAAEENFYEEYLDLKLSVKIVEDMNDAIDHIHKYGSGHSESIVTKDYNNAEKFLRNVDSSAVFVNSSTRFHDGGEFGLGAEVGISTQKLHARGVMGVEGLTCLKYIVYGNGEIRE